MWQQISWPAFSPKKSISNCCGEHYCCVCEHHFQVINTSNPHILASVVVMQVSGEYPPEDEGQARSYIQKRRQRGLLLSFAAMVFVSLANKVFQKLETIPMYNYPNFLSLFTTFVCECPQQAAPFCLYVT